MVMEVCNEDTIDVGKYIIIQRQKYTKLQKFGSLTARANLGNDQIELENIAKCKYFTTFKMIPKGKGKQRLFSLELAEQSDIVVKDNINLQESGSDNRNIIDDGKSQKLSKEEIEALRENTGDSTEILETLISNSNTFHAKTEYSQEKYIRKKQKKYFEYISIKKPTIRLIAEIMIRQDPGKILGIRSDILSQILSYSNINEHGNHLLYDSGSNGLLCATALSAIGADTTGRLIHMHPGNTFQKQALLAMNFPSEQLSRCVSVNIYSVLRHFYQDGQSKRCSDVDMNISHKRKLSEVEDIVDDNPTKKANIDDENQSKDELEITMKPKTVPCWKLDNEKACFILRDKVDSLIITSKEHPLSIFKSLLPFVKTGRPFVIFNQYKEPIQECYSTFKKMPNVTCLKMTSSWMRNYQVMTNRTHPDVLMQGSSGFLLCGWIVQ